MSPRPIEFPVEGLSDGLVLIRLPSDADTSRIVAACRDPEVVRYTTVPSDYRPQHSAEWMQRGMAGLAAGTDVHCVIAAAADSDVYGTISLHEIDRLAGRCVSGYLLGPWARGRGFAARALRLMCRFAFQELRLARVEVTIEAENAPSLATARAVGFREEGLLRSYMTIAGRRRDMLMYSLLPDDVLVADDGRDATLGV